ncbi:MAG: ribosome small subunit-dependent GTPase A [Muribaculaceae bacterium]|nr:ribosome small subunit-dependent GTPase A [Muribaculaceae bacterium]
MAKKKSAKSSLEHIAPEQGLVVKNLGSAYLVRLDSTGETVSCRAKGSFRIQGIRTTNPVAVGDRVEISLRDADTQYITSILPRRNYIIRRASNLSKESHILASNLDQAILVVSIVDPATPTTFIDRFLATAEAYNVEASIVINKADLWDADDTELAEAVASLYRSLGYKVLIVSARKGRGIDNLIELTRDRVSLMAGNSGVGKSSLINVLAPEADLRTGEISDQHHTGMHTTTFSEMVDLPYGGELIDVPGVKGFGVIDFAPEEVSHFFPEIFRIGRKCKYGDCRHTGEPGCAVIPAVEAARIAQSRYASYLSILEETEEAAGADKYRKPF